MNQNFSEDSSSLNVLSVLSHSTFNASKVTKPKFKTDLNLMENMNNSRINIP